MKLLPGILLLLLLHTETRAYGGQTTAAKPVTKDSTVKLFYDSAGNILSLADNNRHRAKYYRVLRYRNGVFDGFVNDHYMNGRLMMTGYYSGNAISKGNENGKFTWYFENGKIFQACSYSNGLLDGPYTEYYPTGTRKALVYYTNGKRYGCEYAWDEEGTIMHRAFMEENGVLYNRQECDTTFLERVSQIGENSAGLSEVFLQEYADGEYREIDSFLFYKPRGINLLSVTLLNDNLDTISKADIAAGTSFRVHITVTGFAINKDNMCDCSANTQTEYPDGTGGGSVGSLYSHAKDGSFEIRLGDTPLYIKDKDTYLFFYVRDRVSKRSIRGFVKYRLHW